MSIFLLTLLPGLIPAAIAQDKGKNFFLWWICGAPVGTHAERCLECGKPITS